MVATAPSPRPLSGSRITRYLPFALMLAFIGLGNFSLLMDYNSTLYQYEDKNIIWQHHPLDLLWKSKNESLPESLSILFDFTKNFKPSDDHGGDITDFEAEKERCQRYGYKFANRTKRRRLFFGTLIAEDSWHPILAHAAEVKGLYHTAAFVETNKTTSSEEHLFRKWRFTPSSVELQALQSGIFGPSTKVTVDYHIDDPKLRPTRNEYGLDVETLARRKIQKRWKENGMTEEDVGIVSDLDEFFSRDYLLAAMSCDIPVFRPGQDCRMPKIGSKTLIFETSPECVADERFWYHPDMIIGECVESIGNETLHKSGLREWNGLGPRIEGYGLEPDDYSKMPNTTMYPLWNTAEIRDLAGGNQARMKPKEYYGFHLHNFFMSQQEIRNKYRMYSHPDKNAYTVDFGYLNADTMMAYNCALDRPDNKTLKINGDNAVLRMIGGTCSV